MLEFGHIGIPVVDLETSISFYTVVLECELVERHDFEHMTLVFLNSRGTLIELISKKEYTHNRENPSPIDHIAFKVDNMNLMYEKIVKLGYEILVEPMPVGNSRIMFFRGPNNEKIEFCEGII